MNRAAPLLLAGTVVLAACTGNDAVAPATNDLNVRTTAVTQVSGSYLLMSNGNSFDAKFAEDVKAAGGTLVSFHPQIGVAFASSDNPAFATRAGKIKGVNVVAQDVMVRWVPEETATQTAEAEVSTPVESVVGGSDETFYNAQWSIPSIGADLAIAAGNTGAGARVAILDGGLRHTHIDLIANIDAARSRSFVPPGVGALWNWNADTGTFWHGTHVAGIVAAADNGVGTIGVAPGATLIGVKVLHAGSGSFQWIIDGMMYAATPIAEGGAGADILNMSLGATFERTPKDGSNHLNIALGRAAKYARAQGALVIAAAGNNGIDMNHEARVMSVPAQSVGVTTVAATGPSGWKAAIAATNFTDPASYTNYGNGFINIAGPGGDARYPGNELCVVPRIPSGTIVTACWVFDMIISPSRGSGTSTSSYSWAAGTSMAAPAASGVAALIIGKYGKMSPQALEAALLASATDVNKPGNDPYSGRGYINAWNAVNQ